MLLMSLGQGVDEIWKKMEARRLGEEQPRQSATARDPHPLEHS
jgi:hypothetical protein